MDVCSFAIRHNAGIAYDLKDLGIDTFRNTSVHERVACLFQRADEFKTDFPGQQLLVVLDHVSQITTKVNPNMIWNHLTNPKHWKGKDENWMLFVVESDPRKMIVDGESHGRRIFKPDYADTISIPFTGGLFFERIMRSLTTKNPAIITMGYPAMDVPAKPMVGGWQPADREELGTFLRTNRHSRQIVINLTLLEIDNFVSVLL